MDFKRLKQMPVTLLIAYVLGNLSSMAQATPPRGFTDWCLNQDTATPGQQQVIQLLQELSREDDCAAADEHLRERLALTINGLDLTDVEVFTALPQLTHLNLDNNHIADWRPLTRLPNLESLNLRDNQISDASLVTAMPQLNWIDLSGNPIQNYEPLIAIAHQVHVRAQRPRQALLVPPSIGQQPGYQLGKIHGWDRRSLRLSPATPAKVFEFQVESGDLQILLDPESSQTLAMSLYQKNENNENELIPWLPIDFPQINQYGEQVIQYQGLDAGSYHLFVHQDPSHSEDTDFSILLLHGLPSPYLEQEPNDTPNLSGIQQLPPLQAETWNLQGSISTDSDPVDNWQFTLERPSRLSLLLKAYQGPAAISLYDENEQQVAFAPTLGTRTLRTLRKDGVAGIDLDLLPTGTYYLQVRPDDEVSSVNYQIVLTGNPIPPNPVIEP
ncbi:MAG: leucine-rich repeat domain-containing protein [Cyanobacteria bacterium P01_B01_bin.77]